MDRSPGGDPARNNNETEPPVPVTLRIKVEESTFRSKPHADVLRRMFDLAGNGMNRALAEGILALDFPDSDAAWIEELNIRANERQLSEDEQAELEAYINVNDLLAYWQSKARQVVRSHV